MNAIAIVKPISVRRGNLAGLRAVIDYVKDEAKTDGGRLVYMSGGMAGSEFQSMALIKKAFGKTTGRQYAHFVQSFHERDDLTPQLAYQIGREYITAMKQWEEFQVVMAVHTNEEHMHIHYIINSVNSKSGSKWQCSRQDLKHFREQSDILCRKYHLHVIERGNRGHQSYGEYTANRRGGAWKQCLAADIAACLQHAKSKADFLHRLDERGLDADFGQNNVMFFVRAGTYGLNGDRKCGDYALRAYGDFSKKNITDHFKLNMGLLALAFDDFSLLQDAFLEVGKMLFPQNPAELQDRYLGGMEFADFDAMTKEEIEAYLKRKKAQQLQLKAWAERDNRAQGGLILAAVADALEQITALHKESQTDYDYSHGYDGENEYEL